MLRRQRLWSVVRRVSGLKPKLLGTTVYQRTADHTEVLWPCTSCMLLRGAASLPVCSKYSTSVSSYNNLSRLRKFGRNDIPLRLYSSSTRSGPPSEIDSTTSTTDTEVKSKSKLDIMVKVQPTIKTGQTRVKTDFTASYTENIFITPLRAMREYLVSSSDLDTLTRIKRRSPYLEMEDITVYLRRDVEQKAIERWGSLDKVQKERLRLQALEQKDQANTLHLKQAWREYQKQHLGKHEEEPHFFKPHTQGAMQSENIYKRGSGKVVVYAVIINATNFVLKFVSWLYTGSHSMFSEMLHSAADTFNQVILAVGLHQSMKHADTEHPYGWASFRNVASLISGVGIFFLGAGLSCYHGIMGLIHPEQMQSLFWAIAVLGGSLASEGGTALMAINQVKISAKANNIGMWEYVRTSQDPTTNVVLLEDIAAVMGVTIAACCMGITYYTGNHVPDAIGSLLIGTLLGGVASFIIYTNTVALVGRSIPPEKRNQLMQELEDDRMIRALHDVKATDVGGTYVRFKAEVDFDGREITRYYLEKQDMDKILQDVNGCSTIEDVELFMLKHGENIVDTLGSEVDRIERNLKKKHPEIRHVDLEQL